MSRNRATRKFQRESSARTSRTDARAPDSAVPGRLNRASRLTKQRFYDLDDTQQILREWFDIDLCDGLKESERAAVRRLLLRRHVYEHSAGVVDEKYLNESGDTTVKLGQAIRETQEDAHTFLNC